ncbi:MAG: hypothetical protein ABIJ21_05745 [Nanoarchaeota archaeon]
MMKKAELAINVVIVAVIAILVLIVLAVILMKGIGQGSDTAFACENAGGACESGYGGKCPTPPEGSTYYRYFLGDSGCKKQLGDGGICCKLQDI